jgi:16S rRNA processing protein RimM
MDPVFPDDAVEVGRVLGAWGVKGWIKVQPFSLDPQALFSTKRWFLQAPPEAAGPLVSALAAHPFLKVIQAREHGEVVVATVQDLQGRDAAEALRGARVFVSRASFPTAGEGEYYWVDLIGLTVVNREGVVLGEVAGLMETGAHDVLRVRPMAAQQADAPPASGGSAGRAGRSGSEGSAGAVGRAAAAAPQECLIPFVAAYVTGVDLAQRRITVDWGLDY